MSYQVFISYAHKDSELASDLARRLKEVGVEVSSDPIDAKPGGDLRREVSRSLRDADEIVMLLTDNSISNSNVIFELGIADALDKPVTPVVVNEGVEQFIPMIRKRFIKYTDLPKYIDSLKERVKAA
jgi:AmiR/NasT family two-component response regulator